MELLVSVKNFGEANVAAKCGVDIIDVKEPALGSLGPASPTRLRNISRQLGTAHVLSAACGELVDFERGDVSHLAGYSFAKIGLAAGIFLPDWRQKWAEWARTVSIYSRPVAVAYIDYFRCRSPEPLEIAGLAAEAGCEFYLMDTFFKQGSNLFDHISHANLARLVREIRALGMRVGVAGSLKLSQIQDVGLAGADLIAVRGAACQSSQRNAMIVEQNILELQNCVTQVSLVSH